MTVNAGRCVTGFGILGDFQRRIFDFILDVEITGYETDENQREKGEGYFYKSFH